MVGYGADATAVVEAVMRKAAEGAIALKGNHDEAIDGRVSYFNDQARAALDWARKALPPEQKRFLWPAAPSGPRAPVFRARDGCRPGALGSPSRASLHVVMSADPAATVLELANANHVDLIVLGAPGPSQRAFAWWRSAASTITAHAGCSVYVVRTTDIGESAQQAQVGKESR